MLIFMIVTLAVFLTVAVILRVLSRVNEHDKVSDAVYLFADKAESITSPTGPYEIGTDLIGVGFTVSLPTQGGFVRLSISRNANQRKPWWVLYEEFKSNEASGVRTRAERHKAEFRANTKTATCLETLQKTVTGKIQPPAPREPTPDPFEVPPNDDPPAAA